MRLDFMRFPDENELGEYRLPLNASIVKVDRIRNLNPVYIDIRWFYGFGNDRFRKAWIAENRAHASIFHVRSRRFRNKSTVIVVVG